MIGQTLAHYKILKKIGSGGMGEVYLAEDTKLDRNVALKVLPPDLAENEERRARFQREAKAIAALDHPNIVQVFSVEEAEGTHFITMQLVQGKTLTELLPKNGFPLNKFFDIAIPLADAVAAAHQEGITHRDLKPDNIMVADDGRVKVLDFGLAKPTGGFIGSEGPTAAKTEEGVIVGTVSYMSPEQAEGKAVDARADVFCLGIILFEMLTGERPFQGDTAASVLSSIIKDTPDSVSDRKPGTPGEVVKIVRRCLAKEPTRRFQSTLDLRNELEEVSADWSSGALHTPAAHAAHPVFNWWLLGAFATFLIVLVAVLVNIRPSSEEELSRLVNPVQITAAVGVEDYPVWAPDGETLAYAATVDGDLFGGNWDIWVVRAAGGPPVNRTRDHKGMDRFPSWSPDGNQIAFWSDRDGGAYYFMPALGGPPRKLPQSASTEPRGAANWSADGEAVAMIVEPGKQLVVVSLATGDAKRSELPSPRGSPFDLAWSPRGAFAWVDASTLANDVTQLWTLSGDEAFQITDGRTKIWSPSWSADGRYLYYVSNRGGAMDLWRQPVTEDGFAEREPEPITTGLGLRHALFSPDATKLAYSRGRLVANVWRVPILENRSATWDDAKQITRDYAYLEWVDVSRDGTLLLSSDRNGNMDLWSLPVDGGEMEQLTDHETPDWAGMWSPDGERIAFYSFRSGQREIWVMPARGGAARQLTQSDREAVVPGWSADGGDVVFARDDQVFTVSAQGATERQLTDNSLGCSNPFFPKWSPDGSWLAFSCDGELGERIWIMSASGEAKQLTETESYYPRWSPDGAKIYFIGQVEGEWEVGEVRVDNGHVRFVTSLAGRRGALGDWALAADENFVYFTWKEDLGDIWVMDVVTDESE